MCCEKKKLTWGTTASNGATIYCRHCRAVYQRGVPVNVARVTRDEMEEGE